MVSNEDLEILRSNLENILLPYFSTTELDFKNRLLIVHKPLSYPKNAGGITFNREQFEVYDERDFNRVASHVLDKMGMFEVRVEDKRIVAQI